MELVGELKQPPQFLFGVHPSLVCPALQPDHAIPVEIGFVQTFGNGEHNDDAAFAHGHVGALHRQGAAHMLRGSVADQLVETSHVALSSPGSVPSSATPIKIVPPSELAKAAISAARESALRDILLELAAAVFAQGDTGFEFLQRHFEIVSFCHAYSAILHFSGSMLKLSSELGG